MTKLNLTFYIYKLLKGQYLKFTLKTWTTQKKKKISYIQININLNNLLLKLMHVLNFQNFFIVFYKIFIFHTKILHKNLDHPQISYSNKNLHKCLTTLTLSSLKLQGAWGRFCLTTVSLGLECTMDIRVMKYLNLKYDWSHWYALIFLKK